MTSDAAGAVHEAKKAGVLEAIKHKRHRGQDTAGGERELHELHELAGHAPATRSSGPQARV